MGEQPPAFPVVSGLGGAQGGDHTAGPTFEKFKSRLQGAQRTLSSGPGDGSVIAGQSGRNPAARLECPRSRSAPRTAGGGGSRRPAQDPGPQTPRTVQAGVRPLPSPPAELECPYSRSFRGELFLSPSRAGSGGSLAPALGTLQSKLLGPPWPGPYGSPTPRPHVWEGGARTHRRARSKHSVSAPPPRPLGAAPCLPQLWLALLKPGQARPGVQRGRPEIGQWRPGGLPTSPPHSPVVPTARGSRLGGYTVHAPSPELLWEKFPENQGLGLTRVPALLRGRPLLPLHQAHVFQKGTELKLKGTECRHS